MRAFVVLVAIGALIVGVPLLLEHERRPGLEALAKAAIDGHVDEMRALLAAGADPNEELDGQLPLEHAARAGHLDVVALLVAHGARVPGGSRAEVEAASRALAGEHDDVRRLLLKTGWFFEVGSSGPWRLPVLPIGSLLFLVAADGDAEAARALVEAGSPLDDARAWDGMRPLSGAAIAGSVPIAKLLLARGVSSTAPTHFGRTPLHHAAIGGAPEIVADLLAAGADPSAVDQLGWTPLHVAALCGHVSAVQALAAPTAAANSIDACDVFGWTALMRAVASGNASAVEELLANGADVHIASASGRTALHIAAERGHVVIYERLVSSGASEDVRDSFETTSRELRVGGDSPLGDLEGRKLAEPIARAEWSRYEASSQTGGDKEFVAWEDGVVLFSDLGSSYPYSTAESLRIGRIPVVRARRLSVELEESAFFRHPPWKGAVGHPLMTRSFARTTAQGDEQSSEFYFKKDYASIDWCQERETNATFGWVLLDACAILESARPELAEPLTSHFVDRRFEGEGSFRGISWRNLATLPSRIKALHGTDHE